MFQTDVFTFFLLLVMLPTSQAAATSQCYFPDGNLATGYLPCTDTSGGAQSWCCSVPDSVCTQNGYCVGNNGLFYRGACTDSTFNSPSCPQMCKNALSSTFSAFFNCADPGTYSQTWCCATESAESCCSSGFSLDFGNPFQPNATQTITVAASTTTSVGSSSTLSHTTATSGVAASVTSPPTRSSSTGNKNGTVIGVGVGVGVGVGLLAIAAMLYVFLTQRQKRKQVEATLEQKTRELDTRKQLYEQKTQQISSSGPYAEEMDSQAAKQASEIAPGRQRYELDHN